MAPEPHRRGALRTRTLHSGDHLVTRLTQDSGAATDITLAEPEDTYVLMVKLRPPHSFDVFEDGARTLRVRDELRQPGNLCLLHRERGIRLALDAPFDIVQFSIPRRTLEGAAGGVTSAQLRPPPPGHHDPAIAALATALLPALEQPARAAPLFVSHAMLALNAHLLHAYGGTSAPTPPGGLAPWQEQRAKELLNAHLDGRIAIAAVAAACRLSPGHFATAFRRSTGCTPTAWVALQRIDRARALLRRRELSLAEVATATGFSDQAHFSRAFARVAGMPPGAWRKTQ